MKWINLCYLFFSVVLACFILYVIIGNMINYCIEDASYYLDMSVRYMKYFLFYVLLKIVYLMVVIFSHHKDKCCREK